MDKLDIVTQPERRKICGLALASLLTINNSVITERFPSIINCIVQVLHDVCRIEENSPISE
jgi:hypothetical protein